jgi:anaerobic magnesium-protoporphyrin IX monomethyl ester cyclase
MYKRYHQTQTKDGQSDKFKGKIVLIDPTPAEKESDINIRNAADFTTGSPIAVREPIAIEHIGAYLQLFGYEVAILTQGNRTNDELAKITMEHDPVLVGISMHSTYLCSHSLNLARRIKELLPSVPIVTGGYHPSGCFDVLKDGSIDYIVKGEGEETLRELSEYIIYKNVNIDTIRGIVYLKGGKLVITPPRPRLDFASLPWAIRNREILLTTKCTPLAYPPPPKQISAAQIAYSRGCPYFCDFCASPLIWGNKLSYRRATDVVDEILYLQERFGTNFLFFNDLSFNVNKKKVLELCREMIKRIEGVHWFAYATIHGMDYEIAKTMRDAGCSRLGFGVESVLDQTLDKIKPRQHLREIKEVLEMTSNLGLLNRCYMLIGWPWESKETLEKTGELIKQLKIDQLRLSFVIPFPGTKFYEQQKHRITRPFEDFSGDNPVMPSEYLSIDELKDAATALFISFYNSKEYQKHVDEKQNNIHTLKPHLNTSILISKSME